MSQGGAREDNRKMRKYVLHGSERVYFEDSPQHYEIPCTQCWTEIPEERVFWMQGTIARPALPTIKLGGGALGQSPFHEGCITSYVAKALAGLEPPPRQPVPARVPELPAAALR